MANTFSQIIKDVKRFAKNRIAYIQQLTNKGYWYYGEADDLPNIIIEGVNNSGTATQALRRKKQFVQAEGFKDERTAEMLINKKGDNFNALLGDIIENVVKLEGFALNLFFNSNGEIASIKCIPLAWLRRKDDETFLMNRLMGELNRDRSKDIEIREFDFSEDKELRAKRIKTEVKKNGGKQVGELYYCFEKKLGRNYDVYPVPSFYSGFDDVISDGKISTLEMRNIVQGWRAPIIISTGVIDDVNLDDDGYTDLDKFNDNIAEFLGEDASPVMHLQGRTPEEMPQVTTIDMKEIVDMTEKATVRVGEKVCRLMGVPPILLGFAKPGQLGNVQEVQNMMSLFYMSIKEWQNWITERLDKLKPYMAQGESLDFEITRLNPFDFLPDKVIERLSDAEIREYFELPELEADPVEPIAMKAESYNDYPEAAKDNARKVLRWIDEHGRDEVQGMTQTGLARANQLANGESLSRETIGRMAAFERHRQNAEISEEYKGEPWKDKGYVAWLGWGGDEGIAWAQRKLKQIENGGNDNA